MKVAYAEIAPEHRPHVETLGPGVFNRLYPDEQETILSAIYDSPQPQYMAPGIYSLENRLPRPLEIIRRGLFQKVELRVMQLDETSTTGAVICDFTPAARRAYRIEQNVAHVAGRIPGLRRKIHELQGMEIGEIADHGVRVPITEGSMIYVTHTRFARNAVELVREGMLINEVQGILYLSE